MSVQLILNKPGPLPITVNFNAPGDSPYYLEVNGSVWTSTANSMIGIQVQLDGQVLGVVKIFSNTPSTHRACVPGYFPIQLAYGKEHTLILSAAPGTPTTSDLNDNFTAVIHY